MKHGKGGNGGNAEKTGNASAGDGGNAEKTGKGGANHGCRGRPQWQAFGRSSAIHNVGRGGKDRRGRSGVRATLGILRVDKGIGRRGE